jgi:Tetracyclin repressor-like, C-terminal domain
LHVGFARQHPKIYPLMFPLRPGPAPEAARQSLELLRAGFAQLAGAGALRPDVTAELATRSLSAALRGVATTICQDPDRRDNVSLAATVRDAVIDALLNGVKEERHE